MSHTENPIVHTPAGLLYCAGTRGQSIGADPESGILELVWMSDRELCQQDWLQLLAGYPPYGNGLSGPWGEGSVSMNSLHDTFPN